MVKPARERVIERLRDVASGGAFTPSEVLFAIVAALHGDAFLNRTDE